MAFINGNNVGALIPDEDAREIIKMAAQNSAAMTMFRTINMGTKIRRLPVSTALASAAFVSGPATTNPPGLKGTSSAAWERKFLTAEEIAVIVPIPEEYLEDSDFDVWGEVRPQIAEAIGAVVDGAVFFGTNKPASWTDDAILTDARQAGNSFVRGSVGGQRLDVDISDMMSLVEADGFDVNGFVSGVQVKGALRGLRDADGQPIYITSVVGTPQGLSPEAASIYGERAMFLKNGAWDADEATLIGGDFSKAILGIRRDITYKILTEATIYDTNGTTILYRLAQQDMVALRATIRLAWAVANPVTRLQGTAGNRYPFGVLRPAGASA